MNFESLKNELEGIIDISLIKYNEPMKYHTSFKVGGPADIFITPKEKTQVADIIRLLKDRDMPFIVIGNGSNLLVRDGGIRGTVICLTSLNKIYVDGNRVHADTGALLSSTSNAALASNLKGLEFASGIPGTVGGAVYMNAGAYGPEIKDVIEAATVMDMDGRIFRFTRDELELSYRNSIIQKNNYIVLEAVFLLEQGNHEDIKARMHELNTRRSDKQPLSYPSAGSTFKRPEGYFAAKLIEDSSLKGTRIGGAMVSDKHSGFIINYDNSTAMDILALIEEVRRVVKKNYSVDLETEVKIIGED